MTLTKQHLVKDVSKNTLLSQNDSAELIEKLLELMKSTLDSGEYLVITRFGKFEVRDKGSRWGRNPHTGEALT